MDLERAFHNSVQLVGNIALLPDLTLCASERVVLRKYGNGS